MKALFYNYIKSSSGLFILSIVITILYNIALHSTIVNYGLDLNSTPPSTNLDIYVYLFLYINFYKIDYDSNWKKRVAILPISEMEIFNFRIIFSMIYLFSIIGTNIILNIVFYGKLSEFIIKRLWFITIIFIAFFSIRTPWNLNYDPDEEGDVRVFTVLMILFSILISSGRNSILDFSIRTYVIASVVVLFAYVIIYIKTLNNYKKDELEWRQVWKLFCIMITIL